MAELGKECLSPESGSSGRTGKGSAYPQNPEQLVELGKGVLTSRIRIKWWNWERECLFLGYGSSGGIGKGSAYLQDTDKVVKSGKGVFISRIRSKWNCQQGVLSSKIRIKLQNWRNRSAHLQNPNQEVELCKGSA